MLQLGTQLRPIREFMQLAVPHDRPEVVARLHEVAQVVERRYTGKTAKLKARIPPHFHEEFAAYIVKDLRSPQGNHK
jgi:50S ribosomal subunit-associated GTPase HflX